MFKKTLKKVEWSHQLSEKPENTSESIFFTFDDYWEFEKSKFQWGMYIIFV